MEYFTTTSAASRRAVDCVIVGIYERGRLGTAAADVDKASGGKLKRLIKNGDLSAQLGRTSVLNDVTGVKAPRVVVVGLGKISEFNITKFRRAFGAALGAIKHT